MGRKRIHRYLVGAYVYALTVDGAPRYIGKGRKHRVLDHMSRIKTVAAGKILYSDRILPAYYRLAAELNAGGDIDYVILANNLSDDEAWLLEYAAIESYPPGELWNAQAGGRSDTGGRRLRAVWADPEQRAVLQAKIRAGHLTDKYRDAAKLKAEAQWADPEFRAKWLAQHKASRADPVVAAERRAALKEKWATKTESRKRVAAAVTTYWAIPEHRAAMAENRRRAWADPEFKRRVVAKVAVTKAKKKADQHVG